MKHKITSLIALLLMGSILILMRDQSLLAMKWALIVFILFIAFLMLAAWRIQWNYFLKSINKGNNAGVSLTFDDGPDPKITPAILDILEEHKIKACFFLIGKNVEKYPELAKEIVNRGHIIANHSYSHSTSIAFFSDKKLLEDLNHNSELILKTTGKKTLWFRPPFGATNPKYAKVLEVLGLTSIAWTLRTYDSMAKTKEGILRKVNRSLRNHCILLLHDTRSVTLAALPDIIELCKKKNLNIVPLNELIGMNPYEN